MKARTVKLIKGETWYPRRRVSVTIRARMILRIRGNTFVVYRFIGEDSEQFCSVAAFRSWIKKWDCKL